jgi:hypothetical protein
VFKAMAKIPGITVQRDVADAAGRKGIALTHNSNEVSKATIILDPNTYEVLGYLLPGKDGQLFSSAVIKHTIVDKVQQTG